LICVRRFYSLGCAAQWGVPKGRKSEPVVFPQRDPAPVEKENFLLMTSKLRRFTPEMKEVKRCHRILDFWVQIAALLSASGY
jgi:hypothetical protein